MGGLRRCESGIDGRERFEYDGGSVDGIWDEYVSWVKKLGWVFVFGGGLEVSSQVVIMMVGGVRGKVLLMVVMDVDFGALFGCRGEVGGDRSWPFDM